MHGEIEDDQRGAAQRGFVERLAGEIDAVHGMSAFAEPSGWGSQSEGLAAEFVSSKKQDFHDKNSIARAEQTYRSSAGTGLRVQLS